MADLIEAVATRRDRDAFARLFAFYAPRVKGFLMRLGANDASADELAQEVLLAVWRKADTFDRRQASVSTWVYRIARNRRIDLARQETRIRRELDTEEAEAPLRFEPERTPEDNVSADDRDVAVRRALEKLPENQAELIRRAFFHERSHREIAEETGLPLGTVKSRLRLAFERLRGLLEELT